WGICRNPQRTTIMQGTLLRKSLHGVSTRSEHHPEAPTARLTTRSYCSFGLELRFFGHEPCGGFAFRSADCRRARKPSLVSRRILAVALRALSRTRKAD